MSKMKEWVSRYLPAEIMGTAGAMAAAGLVFFATDNRVLAAFVGAFGESIFYYGTIAWRDIRARQVLVRADHRTINRWDFLKDIRNIFLEFSSAEILDSFFVRPFCLYFFPLMISPFLLGIFVGKLAADLIFYIPTIMGYELRKQYFKD
ncbi:MAG: hypothetical protein G01um101418_332 [Parcubacteria group bacterium Gr01-1014_18]|nr:MAG: hypothetical protein Greene041636_292 [Parcubacteria group bacterium Greene0416_36]TSC81192.1 MAG: hypothetical protein G01um101418_332 [Parcubacteria group bacterium Gr01-1014_18]TSC99189.1 MAG: hypothetical protein Greene101420_334 [Parcubacteria group bacterium Greene1014_20]TSD07453.1 MAG: hypothetical protein Greene07142_152 [Parcubacteria group bacterium Greene0714_2]